MLAISDDVAEHVQTPESSFIVPYREQNRNGDFRGSCRCMKIPYLGRLRSLNNCWKTNVEQARLEPAAGQATRAPSFREPYRSCPCRSPIRNRKYIQIHGHGPGERVLHGHWHLSSCHGWVPHMRERDRECESHATQLQPLKELFSPTSRLQRRCGCRGPLFEHSSLRVSVCARSVRVMDALWKCLRAVIALVFIFNHGALGQMVLDITSIGLCIA